MQDTETKPLGGEHGLAEFGVTVLPAVDACRVDANLSSRLLDGKPASDERGPPRSVWTATRLRSI